jgi:hypothetical protein
MAKHARHEREQRARETARVKEIEAAWIGRLSSTTAQAFTAAVATARARGPLEPPPDGARDNATPARPGLTSPVQEERTRSAFRD